MQIGIIGRNNYKHPENANPNHIVYGRKWRVESNLPSGEIVQTVFLALKKAREHEIRELLQLQSAQYLKTSAPFSGHQDLGILARLNPVSDQTDELNFERQLKHAFQRIQFDWHKLQLVELQKLPRGNYYLEVRFEADPEREAGSIAFPELIGRNIELIVGKASTNACLQALVRKLIELSDQHTDQHFYYRGTTIFSPDLDIEAVADISIQLRTQEALNCQRFEAEFRAINFQVDSTRVPQIAKEQLAKQDQLAGLQGHLPLGL